MGILDPKDLDIVKIVALGDCHILAVGHGKARIALTQSIQL
jgi:hypothetical protein